MRGFEIIKGFEKKNINLPKRATKYSAGYDFEICEDINCKPGQIIFAPTGVKAFMQKDEVLKLYPRSSLAKKKGLLKINSVGIIDSDYYSNETNDGHIHVALYNFTDKAVFLKKGERVAQGIFSKYLTVNDEEKIAVKRISGFGSTD